MRGSGALAALAAVAGAFGGSASYREPVKSSVIHWGGFVSSEDKFIGIKCRQRCSKRDRKRAHAKCVGWRGAK